MWYFLAFLGGVAVGIVLTSILTAAKKADEWSEAYHKGVEVGKRMNTDYAEWLEEQIEPMLGDWTCDLFAWLGISDYCEENCKCAGPTLECLRKAFELDLLDDEERRE